MAIENVIKKIGSDHALIQMVANELQSNFFIYQDNCFFLMLDKVDQASSQIAWFKKFSDIIAIRNFVFAAEFHQRFIATKFRDNKYTVILFGQLHTIEMEVEQYSAEQVYISEAMSNPETVRMLPWEVLEEGFGELTNLISPSNKKSGAA